ncbi:unnamed protein product [Adineta ricciae]|uniref:Histidine-specific methyltransferase SAM-dependent domain-containing protein n=1 Tax=Adineta ricciae TaxID=249248 RepID=A0A815PUE5_ADIRI|nr:unnamed protein product [Adineta ricciae]CAF1579303.1 unnamed protein product [Adineta ricciae]
MQSNVNYWTNKFDNIWNRSDRLFSLLRSSDDYYRQPVKLRLPLIFYLGHLPCFSWTQFRHLNDVDDVLDPIYDEVFVRGVDPNVQTGIVEHTHSSRFSTDVKEEEQYWRSFTVSSVVEYKQNVRKQIVHVLTDGNLDLNDLHTLNVLNIAAEHEMLHQETLMYLFVQLPIESFRVDEIVELQLRQMPAISSLSENKWVKLPGGHTSLGKPCCDKSSTFSFGWDNEFPRKACYLPPFQMQSHPVRNGDFLQFILDDGYATGDWWDEAIFEWIKTSKIEHPATWTRTDNSYQVNFVLQRNIPVEFLLDHPVILSQIEAKAYCRWLSKKCGETIELPTESEWIYAMWDWSDSINIGLMDDECNVNFRHLHTMPVKSSSDNQLQWQGSAFEWTASVFQPLSDCFAPLPTYPEYSADFFDNRHFVLLGGSYATDLTLIRRSFRNWYQDTYRYMFATFRCVKHWEHTDDSLTEVDRQAIVADLSNKDHHRISSKYFYDAQGSALYTQITQSEEYYLFNQELQLLRQQMDDIKSTILHHCDSSSRTSPSIHFIELGCGDGAKVEAWLTPWLASSEISTVYHPVDISQHAIDSLIQLSKNKMGEKTVEEHIKPICSTFDDMYTKLETNAMDIKAVMLMGSTIGNFASYGPSHTKYGDDAPVMQFIRSIRRNLQIGDWFICAFDMCKDTNTMIRAYSDSKGITAAFNYNLLLRLNRELNFNFDLVNYQHYPVYNPLYRQMESWLLSTKQQTVTDQRGFVMELQPYDAIQTELSTKYTYEDIHLLMELNSLHIVKLYNTDDDRFPYVLCLSQLA